MLIKRVAIGVRKVHDNNLEEKRMKKTAVALLTIFTLTSTGVAFAGGTVPEAAAPAEVQAAPAPAPAPIVAPAPAVVTPVVAPVAYQGWWVPVMAVALVAVAAGGRAK